MYAICIEGLDTSVIAEEFYLPIVDEYELYAIAVGESCRLLKVKQLNVYITMSGYNYVVTLDKRIIRFSIRKLGYIEPE